MNAPVLIIEEALKEAFVQLDKFNKALAGDNSHTIDGSTAHLLVELLLFVKLSVSAIEII